MATIIRNIQRIKVMNLWFHKSQEISRQTKQLLGSHVGLFYLLYGLLYLRYEVMV
jgi:hypothetical protein